MYLDVKIRKALPSEIKKVISFYCDIIDEIDKYPFNFLWQKNVHPSDEFIIESIKAGRMYIALDKDTILSAMVLNNIPCDGYERAAWSCRADDSEIMIVHTLCVRADRVHTGLGSKMVQHAIDVSKANGMRAVHLDVLDGNTPAWKLYTSKGFKYIDSIMLYYECTGLTKFHLFEYVL